jgi:hypothetical protein
MLSLPGQLILLDPHTISPKVFWMGKEIEVIDVIVKKKVCILVVHESTIVPIELESQSSIEVIRK